MGDVLAKLNFIRRENLHAFAPARDRDIPLLLIGRGFDRRIREQDVIHGFALGGVGRDRVAAHELPVIFRQCPAISQSDAPIGMNLVHRHQFTIGEPAPVLDLLLALSCSRSPVDRERFFWLADRDFIQFLERHRPDAVVGLNQQMPVGDAAQFPCAAGFEAGRRTVEHQNGIRLVKPLVAFLCVRQILPFQRRDRCFIFADQLLCFQTEPDCIIDR